MAPALPTSFLVESYCPDPAAQSDILDRWTRQATDALHGLAGRVSYRGSIAVPSDELAMHLFEATDVAAITVLCEEAGVAVDRIVPVIPSRHGSQP
ncbi:MAG: hypothetical protein KF809_17945 [Chloroflexi bacterium]|nr:hypothetical protein [Chloroflexota bacterium]